MINQENSRLASRLKLTAHIKKLEKELRKANQELKKLDQLKSDFVSTVFHELRTPMSIAKESVSQVFEGLHGNWISHGLKKAKLS